MTFSELLKTSGINVTGAGGQGDPDVQDIVYDSRRVKPGAVYVAVPGMNVHGDTFIEQAVQAGAVAAVSENRQDNISVPWASVSEIRTAAGILGRALWDIDLPGITTVGVTGTNGKTTTAYLYGKLFDCIAGQEKTWLFGTIENRLGASTAEASRTTPEAVDVFRYISVSQVRPAALCMEVSSHSLALKRIIPIKYDIAVWTNLTRDHLDFHGSMENYYEAKKSLFTECIKPGGAAVINVDDEYGRRLCGELKETGITGGASKKILTYGRSEGAGVRIAGWECGWGGTSVSVVYNDEELSFTSALRGFFNVYNMAAMIAGALALGIDKEVIAEAFARTDVVPGRMDRVDIDAPFTVVVDYAHTPDALVNVLRTSSELTAGRLICVFGCGGGRDKTKRPLMARAVCENCDMAVVTSDNPRAEKPEAIIKDILKGMPLDFPHVVIADRREAIRCALRNARAGDCVVIAGKGHEAYQEINGTRHHFDDREETVKIFEETEKSDVT